MGEKMTDRSFSNFLFELTKSDDEKLDKIVDLLTRLSDDGIDIVNAKLEIRSSKIRVSKNR